MVFQTECLCSRSHCGLAYSVIPPLLPKMEMPNNNNQIPYSIFNLWMQQFIKFIYNLCKKNLHVLHTQKTNTTPQQKQTHTIKQNNNNNNNNNNNKTTTQFFFLMNEWMNV